jgi:gliding motility-associated-like protein
LYTPITISLSAMIKLFTKILRTSRKTKYGSKLNLIAALLTGFCLVSGVTQAIAAPNKIRGVAKSTALPISSIARLSGLTISVGHLSPVFDPLMPYYADTVGNEVSSVTVTATPERAAATIKINGVSTAASTPSANLPLTALSTTITIVVTAEDGTTKKTYTIIVHRLDNRTLVNSIFIADNDPAANIGYNTSPTFSNTATNYTVTEKTHPKDDQFFVKINKSDVPTTATVNGTPAQVYRGQNYGLYVPAHQGINNIAVEIKAEDGVTTKTFNFAVPRPYNNADLRQLQYTTGDHDFYFKSAFNKDSLNYLVVTKADVTRFYLGASTQDQYATIKINGVTVPSGEKSPYYNLGQSAVVVVTARDGVSTKTYTVNARHQRLNNKLASYTTNAGTLSPAISTNSPEYTLNVPSGIRESTITFRTEDSTARMDDLFTNVGTGSLTLKANFIEGRKKLDFYVTPQDNDAAHNVRRKYTLNIIHLSGNAKLSGLTISNGRLDPGFSENEPESTVYRVTVGTPSITIKPTAEVTTSVIRVNGVVVASGTVSPAIVLAPGDNTITTLVTAQDTAVKRTYTIIVTRTPSNAAILGNIVTSVGSLDTIFSPTRYHYTPKVPNTTTSIQIKPVADGVYPNVTVKVNGATVATGSFSAAIPLSIGNNPISVMVTSADMSETSEYKLNVIRPSINANLATLTINPGTLSPVFSAGVTDYTATVSNATSQLTLNTFAQDTNARVAVKGNYFFTQPILKGLTTDLPLNIGSNPFKIIVSPQDGSAASKTYNLTILRLSDNANLSNIKTSQGVLSPAFAAGISNYTDTVATTSVAITPVGANSKVTIRINGTPVAHNTASTPIPLAIGNNSVTVATTSQDSSKTRTYTINVVRIADNALLGNLIPSVSFISPAFNRTVSVYNVVVTNAVSSFKITPVADASYPGVTVKVNGVGVTPGSASQAIPLVIGNNVISTVVTSAGGTVSHTYTTTVTRQSNNANLTNLTINPGHLSPAFAAATQNYGAFLTHTTTSVDITATPANPNARMTVDGVPLPAGTTTFNQPLKLGSNVIQIVVTSQDGSKVRNYLLSLTRPSDNSNLRNLSITSGPLSPAFAINTLNYAVSVPNDSTYIRVKPYAENSNALITVNGTDVYSNNFSPYIPLAAGANTISVVVLSQDSSKVRTYKIVVTRLSNNANLAGITLSSGTLSPAFAAGTISYTSSVSNATSSITVKPVAVNGHASMKVNGVSVPFGGTSASLPLAVGNNTITVAATSEDLSKTRTYTVTVNRAPATFAFVPQSKTDIGPKNRPNVADNLPQPLVRQAVSPNGDGINDVLLIDGVESFTDNTLKIMNRDGNLVFEKAKYNNISSSFDGHSGINGRQLPAGTYFYSLEYAAEDGKAKHKTGFFVLKY